jgi:hypothetical protein
LQVAVAVEEFLVGLVLAATEQVPGMLLQLVLQLQLRLVLAGQQFQTPIQIMVETQYLVLLHQLAVVVQVVIMALRMLLGKLVVQEEETLLLRVLAVLVYQGKGMLVEKAMFLAPLSQWEAVVAQVQLG